MKTMPKKATAILLSISLLFVCSIAVYAYEVDRVSSTIDGFYCNGTLWTITSKSMGATTYTSTTLSNIETNTTTIRVRSGGYDPVEVTNGPYVSNEVDATASIGGDIGSATGTHEIIFKTCDPFLCDTFY